MVTRSQSRRHRKSSFENLETRQLLANVQLLDVYLVDGDENRISTPAVGEQLGVRVDFETDGMGSGEEFEIRTVTLTNPSYTLQPALATWSMSTL